MKARNHRTRTLAPKQIQTAFEKRLAKYENLSSLEHFAMFMGVAQLLELGLKNVLHARFGIEYERMSRWTLGRVVRILREHGVREDCCLLLDDIVAKRNYVAHEFIANEALLRPFQRKAYPTHGTRKLYKWTYELESLMLFCEQIEKKNAWVVPEAAASQ